MQVQAHHSGSLLPSEKEVMNRVMCFAWTSDSSRLAVCTFDHVVTLFDHMEQRRDRFLARPAEKENSRFIVTGMAFSPDGSKLALSQSDKIVYVFNLGTNWGDKKSICNKFVTTSSVTSITWPMGNHAGVAFGLADGNVVLGVLKSNKSVVLYAEESPVLFLCGSSTGSCLYSCHSDGWIIKFIVSAGNSFVKLCRISACSIESFGFSSLGFVFSSGSDGVFRFWDAETGSEAGTIQIGGESGRAKLNCSSVTLSGDTIVVGSVESVYVLGYSKPGSWSMRANLNLQNMNQITAVSWKADGSRFYLGSLRGGVEAFEVSQSLAGLGGEGRRREGSVEFIFVNPSLVLVKSLIEGDKKREISIRTSNSDPINDIHSVKDRYIVAHAAGNSILILADIFLGLVSEISFVNDSVGELFNFDCESVFLIYHSSEISIILAGKNEVLGSMVSEFPYEEVISCRALRASETGEVTDVFLACLVDSKTIKICRAISSGISLVSKISHENPIDWLELNATATRILFRDFSRKLFLANFRLNDSPSSSPQVHILLSGGSCDYCQWVPDSEVVVAQSAANRLCVWYAIDAIDKVTMKDLSQGIFVSGIERANGRTVVVVEDPRNGGSEVEYELDENLINFHTFLESGNLSSALEVLESLPMTPETDAMWNSLARYSLSDESFRFLPVAERCFSVLGDFSKVLFCKKMFKQFKLLEKSDRGIASLKFEVLLMNGDFRAAESIAVENGKVQEIIAFYRDIKNYPDAIRMCETSSSSSSLQFSLKQLKTEFLQFLVSSGQEDVAAELQEKEGNVLKSLELLLKGGFTVKAALLVARLSSSYRFPVEVLSRVASALQASEEFGLAGSMFEKMGKTDNAIEFFRKGKRFSDACRLSAGTSVSKEILSQWGEDLMQRKEYEQAIEKFADAGNFSKATEAAFGAKLWLKAEQFLESIERASGFENFRETCLKLSEHYRSAGKYKEAESLFMRAKMYQSAVEMYLDLRDYESVKGVISRSSREGLSDIRSVIISRASKFEMENNLSESEIVLLCAGEVDLAIELQNRNGNFSDVIRLVSKFKSHETLQETIKSIAKNFEKIAKYREAENFLCEAKLWVNAVTMYRQLNQWDEAKRVAKAYGGKPAFEKVCFAQATTLGIEGGGIEILMEQGLVDLSINFACDFKKFDVAMELCRRSGNYAEKSKEVYARRAKFNDENGKYLEAEEDYVRAGKYREALKMFVQLGDLQSAIQVGVEGGVEGGSREAVMTIILEELVSKGNLEIAENFYFKNRIGSVENFLQFLQSRKISPQDLATIGGRLRGPTYTSNFARPSTATNKSPVPPSTPSTNSADLPATLEFLFKSGRYDDCISLAEKSAGKELLRKFSILCAAGFLKNKRPEDSLANLVRNQVVFSSEERGELSVIKSLASNFISRPESDASVTFLLSLKKLFNTSTIFSSSNLNLRNVFLPILLSINRFNCIKMGVSPQLISRISHSLCRYISLDGPVLVRFDKALYDAGNDLNNSGNIPSAFYFLNRYLDVVEVMTDHDNAVSVDPAEFSLANLPNPLTCVLPDEPPIGNVEQAKDLVLSWSVDVKISQKLEMRKCENCKNENTFINSLHCSSCHVEVDACSLTGAPIWRSLQRINCPKCGCIANRDDWEEFTRKCRKCPLCDSEV